MSKKEVKNLEYCERVLSLKKDIEGSFLVLGEYLHEIKASKLYEPQWSSFEEFSFELKMSTNTVNKLMQIYRTFVLEYEISRENIITAGGWSVISDLLPVVDSKRTALHWLNAASNMTRADLRKELIEAKTGVSMQTCKHPAMYTISVCRDCGYKQEVH
ncbi:MAG: hypothetical protein KW793_03590 [Candidatus Doudnabacteria bacterium]|nr:hypothetical protein [Candidatus Doudnabacteria bacterium]